MFFFYSHIDLFTTMTTTEPNRQQFDKPVTKPQKTIVSLLSRVPTNWLVHQSTYPLLSRVVVNSCDFTAHYRRFERVRTHLG